MTRACAAALLELLALLGPLASASTAQEPAPAQAPAQPAEPAIPVDARLYALFEGALLDTRNGQGFAETPGYAKLLQIVASYSAAEVAERARELVDYDALMLDPGPRRGEFVRVMGLLGSFEAVRLEQEIFGARDVYRGVLAKADGSEGVVFDMLERPADLELLEDVIEVEGVTQRTVRLLDDVVEIEGVLYRTVRYENKKSQLVDAPWLVAKTLRRVDPATLERTAPRGSPLKVVLIAAAVAILLWRAVLVVLQRRKGRGRRAPEDAGIREMLERHRKDNQ